MASSSKITSAIVALTSASSLVVIFFYNQSPANYNHSFNHFVLANLAFLLFLPMIVVLGVFRDKPEKYGFSACGSVTGWLMSLVAFIIVAIAMIAVAGRADFQAYYPYFARFTADYGGVAPAGRGLEVVSEKPFVFAYAWFAYGFYMFGWEYFFRGYMLFGLQRSIGLWAVVVQAIAFGIMHIGKPIPEVIGSFIAGIVLGLIALNSKSFFPAFVLHWASAVLFDILVLSGRSA